MLFPLQISVYIFLLPVLVKSSFLNVPSKKLAYVPEDSYDDFPLWNDPRCDNGLYQSPVDLTFARFMNTSHGTVYLYNYTFNYHECDIYNSGNGVGIGNFPPTMKIRTSLLPDFYVAEFIQFHWKAEHFDVKHCDLEMQIYHRNEKYANLSQAFEEPDGILALAVPFEVMESSSQIFAEIALELLAIRESKFIYHMMRPHSREQFSLEKDIHGQYAAFYEGSLTVPPCYESVIWIVVLNSLGMPNLTLQHFKAIQDEFGHPVLNNNRFIQEFNDRIMKRVHITSFELEMRGLNAANVYRINGLLLFCIIMVKVVIGL